MNQNFVNQVELSDSESNLNISQQSINRELNDYVPYKPNQIKDINKCIALSEQINKKIKDCHSLMMYKDIDFFAQYIDDLYVLGIDVFNMIEIIQSYEDEQENELQSIQQHNQIQQQQKSKEKLEKMEIYIEETSNQKKYHNISIQEVELDAMFEEMNELEKERTTFAEGFDPQILGSINIPDIDDSLNLVFLWCTIALYGNYKEDYYWENFKEQVFKNTTTGDFLERLLHRKASKLTRDQSFIANEIFNKQEEFLAKKYLKKKQKVQLEKLFEFIKNFNECWRISQEIRSKVLYFDQVQREFLELEVMKAQQSAEKTILKDKMQQFNVTKESLKEAKQFLEGQLSEIVELQQSGEQYLVYLNQAQKKFFPYYDKVTISKHIQGIEDMVFNNNTGQPNEQSAQVSAAATDRHLMNSQINLRDSQILLMNHQDVNSLDGQTIPSFRSNLPANKIKPLLFERDQNFKDALSIGETLKKDGDTMFKQFDNFDAEEEIDKSFNSNQNAEEDEDDPDKKGKQNDCNIF